MSTEYSYNKYDVVKLGSIDFTDEMHKVIANTVSYKNLESYLSPIVSKAQDIVLISKDEIERNVKRNPNMNSFMFGKMADSAIDYYMKNKNRKLPITDLKTHRSAHFKSQLFQLKPFDVDRWRELNPNKNYQIRSVHQLTIDGLKDTLYVENLSTTEYKYLILRPKLSKMGNISNNWEVLLFRDNINYYIDHIDLDYIPGKNNR